MNDMNDMNDMNEVIAAFGLPELPEPADYDPDDDDPEETVELVLFRFKDENIVLDDGFALEDAQEYCQRDDTSGGSWFVGYRR